LFTPVQVFQILELSILQQRCVQVKTQSSQLAWLVNGSTQAPLQTVSGDRHAEEAPSTVPSQICPTGQAQAHFRPYTQRAEHEPLHMWVLPCC
jgi:hypothetical protein